MKLTRIDLYLGGVGVEADTPFLLKFQSVIMTYDNIICK